MERFPVSEREKEQNSNLIERNRANKGQEHNHNREVIFALPSLRLHFKSEHLQGPTTPDTSSGSFLTQMFNFNFKNLWILWNWSFFSRLIHRKTVSSMQFYNWIWRPYFRDSWCGRIFLFAWFNYVICQRKRKNGKNFNFSFFANWKKTHSFTFFVFSLF